MAGIDHEEKRQFQRMQLSSQLQFRRVGNAKLYKGETLDLSATGIRFITSEVLKDGDVLQLVIKSQHTQIAPLVAEGKVMRAAALNQATDKFEISLFFTELN